jgi:transposase, IS5 family
MPDECNAIAKKENIKQRQTYVRVAKQLVRDSYNSNHPKRKAKAKKSQKKIKTLAGRLVREIGRNTGDKYSEKLELFQKIIKQGRADKDKIYSLHKPETACIAKGKASKQYEFGNKIGLVMHPKNKLILAIESYKGNPHDSQTIEPLIQQMKSNLAYTPKEIVYDRGGRGQKTILGVPITTPTKKDKNQTHYQKQKIRNKFKRRAAIEPVIAHLKHYFRMGQNYYNMSHSSKINALLAATGWNLKKKMESLLSSIKNCLQNLFNSIFKNYLILSY